MTPRLVPHTVFRHLAPGVAPAAAALVAWGVGAWLVVEGVDAPADGPLPQGTLLLMMVALVVPGTRLAVEAVWERPSWSARVLETGLVTLVAALLTLIGLAVVHGLVEGTGLTPGLDPAAAPRDPLRTVPAWTVTGLAVGTALASIGLGRAAVRALGRRLDVPVEIGARVPAEGVIGAAVLQLLAGLAAGLGAGVLAYLGGVVVRDLHGPTALAAASLGAMVGALGWRIPRDGWVGWVRVLRGPSGGHRVRLDPEVAVGAERIVGSFPGGLDLYLPSTAGVDALHASFVTFPDGSWAVRGLAATPLRVGRWLEEVDLTHGPDQPAPYETPLVAEDRVVLGERSVVELVVLPREDDR